MKQNTTTKICVKYISKHFLEVSKTSEILCGYFRWFILRLALSILNLWSSLHYYLDFIFSLQFIQVLNTVINPGKQTNINARSALVADSVYEGTTPCKQLKVPTTIAHLIPKSQTSQITGIFFLTLPPSPVGRPKEQNDHGKHGKLAFATAHQS